MHTFILSPWTRRIAMLMVVAVGFVGIVPKIEASFVPSNESFPTSFRNTDMRVVQKILEHKMVRERLSALGYTEEEIQDRLNQLTDEELHSLATQIDAVTAGGDGFGIIISLLVIIILVLVILHLAGKRIIVQ